MAEGVERHCASAECGKPLVRKRRESRASFERRLYCNMRCANEGRSYEQRSKRGVCMVCGAETVPVRRSTGWRLPKTCLSDECVNASRQAKVRANPKTQVVEMVWTDPLGREHEMPKSPRMRKEYRDSIMRRIRKGEAVAMQGDDKLYAGRRPNMAAA